MFRDKRGVYFFVIDVVIAVLIFAVTILVLVSFNVSKPSFAGVEETRDLLVADLFATQIVSIGTSQVLQNLQLSGDIADLDSTIDQVVVELVNDGQTAQAENLLAEVTSWVQPQYGLAYSVDNVTIYQRNALLNINDSFVSVGARKVTLLEANFTYTPEPVISEVIVWQ